MMIRGIFIREGRSLPFLYFSLLPDIAPVILEPSPLVLEHALPEEQEDLEEEEFEEEEEPQEEEELEDEMDMDLDDEIDDPEVIYPYEVEDGEFPPPPSSNSEPKDETVPTGCSTLHLLPPVRRFSRNFYVREGSLVANHHKVFASDPLGKDVNALHYKVKSLAQQMSIKAKTEFSNLKRLSDVECSMKEFNSDLRDEMQSRNKLEWNMTTNTLQMDLNAFIRTADPRKVKIVERARVENEVPIVTVAKHRTVTLLPTSVPRTSGELSASVEREFAGDASIGDGVDQGVDSVAGGDYAGPSVPVTGACLARHSIEPKRFHRRKGEQGVPTLPTLPFITSSVTASPLGEGEDRTDSVTGPSLRTKIIGLLRSVLRLPKTHSGEVASAHDRNVVLEQECTSLQLKVAGLESIIAGKDQEISDLGRLLLLCGLRTKDSFLRIFHPHLLNVICGEKDDIGETLGMADLQPDADQLMVPIHHKQDGIIIGSQALSVALKCFRGLVPKLQDVYPTVVIVPLLNSPISVEDYDNPDLADVVPENAILGSEGEGKNDVVSGDGLSIFQLDDEARDAVL
ncbi:hypothetical protein Tco_1313010 [Tanacetum coccineum]